MTMIADILLVAGALGASVYCYVLARRLAKFNDLEAGVGGAVAVLSTQVDDLTRTLKSAQATAGSSTKQLQDLTARAETASKRMELLLASMHDLPDADELRAFREAQSTTMFVRHSDGEFGTPVDESGEDAEAPSKSKSGASTDAEETSPKKRQKQRKRRNKNRGKQSSKQDAKSANKTPEATDDTAGDAPAMTFKRAV
ncbi:MAG: hypothetical protein ACU0A6_02515 [Shimia sp.]|uniref:hypothetical protein n=1 Tax=Shimia sp. TaxID=1954381 RepID=UPI0040591172